MEKKSILSYTINELENELIGLGEKKFRASQIYEWLHQKNVNSFDEMTNVSKELMAKLEENYFIENIEIAERINSNVDDTKKYLIKLKDGNIVECVVMKYKYGNSICISSQVGCKMGCKFCASTINGFKRNLRASEMLKEIYVVEKDLGERISNVVVMGIGEPLENYDELVHFLRNIINPKGLNIGARHITVSTCGLVEKIERLADEKMQINLAISLHASNDKLRREIMPIANKYQIKELINACKYYIDVNNRRMNFEYALIKGVNDKDENALEVARLLRGMLCFVNLIPINEVEETGFKKSSDTQIKRFAEILKENGIETTIRRKLGSDIEAACGQLRNKYEN